MTINNKLKTSKMKNNLIKILALVLVIAITSCSSDDDGSSVSQESKDLVGVWDVDFLIVDGQNEFNVPCIEQTEFEFRNDLTYSERNFDGIDPGDCSVASDANGTWEDIQEGVLLLKPAGNNSSKSYTIDFLPNNRMELSQFGSSKVRIFKRKN